MFKSCQTEYAHQRKKLLQTSLLDLLDVKPYQDITVKDICQQADIPRRTFYHYFESKEDVLDTIVADTMMLCSLEVASGCQTGKGSVLASFSRIFRFWQVDEYRRRLDLLLKNGLEPRLMTYSSNWVRTETFSFLRQADLDPKLMEIGLMVGVVDFFSLLFYWSRNGYQETAEQMAEYAVWVLPRAFYNG